MKIINLVLILAIQLLAGCASYYGPKNISGGYSDRVIDSTTFFIRYESSQLVGPVARHSDINPLWDRRAEELCGSKDYYPEKKLIRLDGYGNELNFGRPAIDGLVYCNNRFVDTRKQSPEENYLHFITLSREAITYKEISPFWELLVNNKHAELQATLENISSNIDQAELSSLLETFSRINPIAEEHLQNWVSLYPDSYLPLYSRAVYYHSYSWFQRGNRLWKDVTQEQRRGLEKYRSLAINDINKSLKIKPDFCPAHALKLLIHTSIHDESRQTMKDIYSSAQATCQSSVAIHKAYLRHLLPRWGGSKSEMRAHIAKLKKQIPQLDILEALYLAEEGEQFFWAKDFEKALENSTAALAFADFPEIYHLRGLILESSGRYVEAFEDYDMAVKLDPYFNGAYESLVRVLLKQDNLIGALLASSYLTAMNNQDADNFEREGDIFYFMRRYEDALLSYKKAQIISSQRVILRHKIRKAEYQLEVRKGQDSIVPSGAEI